MNADWRTRYEVAIDAAQKAGRLALEHFDNNVQVEWKEDRSPVTVADRKAEAALKEALLAKFPQDGFLGEESGNTPGSSGYRWIVDPIDGTRNFVRGIPIWATLVGLEYKGEQIAGVCYLPAMEQMNDYDVGGLKVSFNPTDHQGLKNCYIYLLEAGKISLVK